MRINRRTFPGDWRISPIGPAENSFFPAEETHIFSLEVKGGGVSYNGPNAKGFTGWRKEGGPNLPGTHF